MGAQNLKGIMRLTEIGMIMDHLNPGIGDTGHRLVHYRPHRWVNRRDAEIHAEGNTFWHSCLQRVINESPGRCLKADR